MLDRASLRNRFLRDGVAIQLGNLAANLARLHSYAKDPRYNEIVANLLDESRFLVEWAVPNTQLEQQFVLADLQRVLTRWFFTWPQLSADPLQRTDLGKQAQAWSDKILTMSGLLAEPATESERAYA